MASNSITFEFTVPRWRLWIAKAVVRVARLGAHLSPPLAIRAGEWAVAFATRRIHIRTR